LRARAHGIAIGDLPTGEWNAITDVAGVAVGEVTLFSGADEGAIRTGVTAVVPHGANVFADKVTAAVHCINGFGKPTGWAQIDELGTLETPIVLTNTLSVGHAFAGLVEHALRENPGIGAADGSVNPVVAECYDGDLNDIRGLAVQSGDVVAAIDAARSGPVREGAVGAGTGMTCFGWKGGLGSASRLVPGSRPEWTVGTLVLANFGRPGDLTIQGVEVGREVRPPGPAARSREPGGSVVVVLATDAPLDARQLGRLARRAQNGLARLGGDCEHGSGEVVIAFSTTHGRGEPAIPRETATLVNPLFRAVADTVEESVLNALLGAETVTGRGGVTVHALPVDRVVPLLRQRVRTSR
jgi:D-aminopeptidase